MWILLVDAIEDHIFQIGNVSDTSTALQDNMLMGIASFTQILYLRPFLTRKRKGGTSLSSPFLLAFPNMVGQHEWIPGQLVIHMTDSTRDCITDYIIGQDMCSTDLWRHSELHLSWPRPISMRWVDYDLLVPGG